ncbi:MAG TPA: hypothetical protein VFF78_04955 [Anaerolineaceae bacterium]|nr:hypothetical protein [Anaerolineaceae bacterium]
MEKHEKQIIERYTNILKLIEVLSSTIQDFKPEDLDWFIAQVRVLNKYIPGDDKHSQEMKDKARRVAVNAVAWALEFKKLAANKGLACPWQEKVERIIHNES